MNNDKRKIEEENEKRRQEINYYQDENLKLLYSKKLRDKAEENDRKYEENKIIRENKREIEKENENARKRRQDYVNLNEENYRNYKSLKEFRESKGLKFGDTTMKKAYDDYMDTLIKNASGTTEQ